MVSDLLTLLDEREIHWALCRYARACDERDWAAFETIFAAHVVGDYGAGYRVEGRDALVAMASGLLNGCGPTQHLLGNLVVAREGEQLFSRIYVRAVHRGRDRHADSYYEVWAQYEDHWQRTAEGWRIVHRRMRVDNETGSRDLLGPG